MWVFFVFGRNTSYQLKLFPNPTNPNSAEVFIDNFEVLKAVDLTLQVFSINGQKVGHQEVVRAKSTLQTPQTKGIYLVTLVQNRHPINTVKWVVQ